MKITSKFYLPNLNSLRAIAALMVIMCHLLEGKSRTIVFLGNFGSSGVTIFFVLSGFLITYLLLMEQKVFSKININAFYFRRILRIWPLYFLILFIAYVVIPFFIPEDHFKEMDRRSLKSFLMNVFFLTNFTLILKLTPLIIRVIWSIGIEEQFYIFWPWLIKMKEKKRIGLILLIIIIFPFSKLFFVLFEYYTGSNSLQIISSIITVTRFDSMAIGGLFGILAFCKKIDFGYFTIKYESITSKKIQWGVYFSIFTSYLITFIYPSLFQIINYILHPCLFAICIVNLATNSNSVINIENNYMNYLGKISYGLYLIHQIVIYLMLPRLKAFFKYDNVFLNYLLPNTITLAIIVFISGILYKYYESPFFRLKNKYANIKT